MLSSGKLANIHITGLFQDKICGSGINNNFFIKIDMYKIIFQILVPIVIWFTIGCSVTTSSNIIEKSQIRGTSTSITKFQTWHSGPMAWMAGAYLGHMIEEAALNDEEVEYVSQLNKACWEEITKKLSENTLFIYVPQTSITPNHINKEDIQFIPSNNQGNQLQISLEFLTSHDDQLVLYIQWLIINKTGETIADIKTAVVGEKYKGFLQNTRNPKFESQFVELASKSAEDFLLFLDGKSVKYSKKYVPVFTR